MQYVGDTLSTAFEDGVLLIPCCVCVCVCVCVWCRMSKSWEEAQHAVAKDKSFLFTNRKKILLFPGLVSSIHPPCLVNLDLLLLSLPLSLSLPPSLPSPSLSLFLSLPPSLPLSLPPSSSQNTVPMTLPTMLSRYVYAPSSAISHTCST